MKHTTTTVLLIASLVAGSAAASEPHQSAAGALDNVAQGKLPCTHLQVQYETKDTFGSVTTITIVGGLVKMRTTRVGFADEVHRGDLPVALCRRLARQVVEQTLWRLQPPRSEGLEDELRPTLRIGVLGYGDFAKTLPLRPTEALRPLLDAARRVTELAEEATRPKRSAAR